MPFRNHDLDIPGELYNVLAKALSKNPEKRFGSLDEFANAIVKVRDAVFEDNQFYVFSKQNTAEQFVSFFLQKFGWDSPFIENGLLNAPTCSVNYGAAGIAYMYYRLSCVRQDAELSDLADVWARRASSFKDNYDRAFYAPVLGINEKTVGKRSLYHSPTGIYLTQALISNSRNDLHILNKAVKGFLSAAKEPCDKIDLVLGKAGLLIGYSLLYRELITVKNYPLSEIILPAEEIKNEIWQLLNEYPFLFTPNPVDYLGMAHGWAGLLYATLLWCNTSSCSLPQRFMDRVDELLGYGIQKENSIRWPLTVRDQNSWPGWCNGNAGYIFLWLLLYKQFNDEKYCDIAEKTA